MSGTVDVQISGDTPTALPVDATDAIEAAFAILAMCRDVLTETEQTGLSSQEAAGIAQAAAAAAQAASAVAYNRTTVADANRTGVPTDMYVEWSAITAPRTYTLPLASTCAPGKAFVIADASGNCSSTNTITILNSGSDAIVGVSPSPSIVAPGGVLQFWPTAGGSFVMK